jgi:hypothetical protein
MMKMMGWMLMIVGMMSLTSCEVEIRPWHDDVCHDDNTYELCSRTWEETWVENGNRYTQRLDFYNNRTGRDFLRIEYWDGYVSEDTYHFKWRWDDADCIRMEYGPGDISYLEDICIHNNTLIGYLDDVEVFFKGRL